MSEGEFPCDTPKEALALEPLCFWVPRLVPPQLPMTAPQRKALCASLLVQQDDAWQAVIARS